METGKILNFQIKHLRYTISPHMINGVIDVEKYREGLTMLIQALCDYYDILSAEGKVLPEGYSKVKIHYLISLTEEGNDR